MTDSKVGTRRVPADLGCKPRLSRRILTLFLVALVARWGYVLATVWLAGVDGLTFGDSYGYLAMAARFSAAISGGGVEGWAWFGPELSLMPLFTWSLTAHVALAGAWAPVTFVVVQGLLDAGTCLAVFGIARALDERIALWAGYVAAATPTLVILSGIVYTDTAFVFFSTLSLFGAVSWLRYPRWRWAIVAGVGLGCAALVRVWIVPWAVPLFLLLALGVRPRPQFRVPHLLQLVAIPAILGLCLAPVVLRNASVYGAWSLTPQSGVHLAMWIVPLVREAKDGTPRAITVSALEARMRENPGASTRGNPFTDSLRYRKLAVEELRKLGVPAIVKAWIYGIAINLASPAVTIVPTVAKLPRTGFYDTPGRTSVDKVTNFLFRSENALYTWFLVIGIVGAVASRLVQAAGAFVMVRGKGALWPLAVMIAWALYVLMINGPIASPKYRLPIEPVLAVMTGGVLARVRLRWSRR